MGKQSILALVMILSGCGKVCLVFPESIPVHVKTTRWETHLLTQSFVIWDKAGYHFQLVEEPVSEAVQVGDLTFNLEKDWGWSLKNRILLNPEMGDEYVTSTFAHELGHYLGLEHVDENVWPGCHLMNASSCNAQELSEPEYLMLGEVERCEHGDSPAVPALKTGLYHG